MTDLDRQFYLLSDYRKKYNNLQLRKCIEVMLELIQRFKRRSEVMLQIIGKERLSTDEGALIGLVQTVEDALVVHTTKVVKRIEIFDDLGVPEVIHRNIKEIEDQIKKCQDILMEFELLITETSRLGELKEDNDISKLRDVVNAMQSLRSDSDTEMDALKKKYENEGN